MSFVRIKTIKGHQYYYLVRSERENRKIKQRHIKYIGKSLCSLESIDKEELDDSRLDRENLERIPNDKPGVYYLYNKDRRLIYIGRSGDNEGYALRHRISAHYQKDDSRPEWENRLSRNAAYFTCKTTTTDSAARSLEKKEIERYQPRYNHYSKN